MFPLQPDFFREFAVHGLVWRFIRAHTTLWKLPCILANAARP
jgi:hypothetical protein